MRRIGRGRAWTSGVVVVSWAVAGSAQAQPDAPAPEAAASLERPAEAPAKITFGVKPAPSPDPIIEGPATAAREERPIALVVDAPGPGKPAKTTAPPRPPMAYSIPWQLRSIGVSTGIRADTTFATYE